MTHPEPADPLWGRHVAHHLSKNPLLLWRQGGVLSPPLALFDFHRRHGGCGVETELLPDVMPNLFVRGVFEVLGEGSQLAVEANPGHLNAASWGRFTWLPPML